MRIDRHAPNRLGPTPDSASYRTRAGDTLRTIAERLGIRLADLVAVNPRVGSADAPLPAGWVIRLPTRPGPSPTSFRVEYERARLDVFHRLAGPSPTVRPSAADPWLTELEKTLSQEASALKLVKALKDFLAKAAIVRDPSDRSSPDVAVRVGRMIYQAAQKARSKQNLSARLDALTKFVQGVDSNYEHYRGQGFPADLAMSLAVIMTFFQSRTNSVLMELFKDAYPQCFPKPGLKLQVLDLINAALGFTEKILGIELPQSWKDAFKVMKYLPTSAVASLVGDGVKLMGDVLLALQQSSMGDFRMWDQIIRGMLNQDYGPAFQGFAFLADLLITGGRNIEMVPMDKILFADLFDTGPVFHATPQLDRFLRTLRQPTFLYGLYQTGQLDPAAVAGQLFTDVEQNGTRLNFVGRLEAALKAVAEEVRTGGRSYEEWAMFREVVGGVVAEVLRRVDLLGPVWTARFRQEVDPDALRRLYRRLNDPATDQELRMWAELHGVALGLAFPKSDEGTQ